MLKNYFTIYTVIRLDVAFGNEIEPILVISLVDTISVSLYKFPFLYQVYSFFYQTNVICYTDIIR